MTKASKYKIPFDFKMNHFHCKYERQAKAVPGFCSGIIRELLAE